MPSRSSSAASRAGGEATARAETVVTSRAATGSVVLVGLYRVTVLGVVLHELAHQFVAELFGLEVRSVDYTSHVVHELPRSVVQAVLVAVAPLVVNTVFAVAAFYVHLGRVPFDPAALALTWIDVVVVFVAFSLLFRAMPSTRDVRNVFTTVRQRFTWSRPDVVLAFVLLSPALVPLYLALRIADATGTRVIVDLGYAALGFALLMGVAIPVVSG